MPGAQHAERLRKPAVELAEQAAPVARAAAPTLTVGAAFDPAEHEADRVADQVVARLRGGEGGDVHQHSAGCGHGDLQRVAAPSDAPVVGMAGGALSADLSSEISGRRGGGSALSGELRDRMEGAFGTGLGDVRIHTDATAAKLSRQVSAKAFTTGKDIFFGAGQFRPDTAEGEHMLAHELAHTRQQGGVQRTAIHRVWDFTRPVDWGKLKSIGTVTSGQPVYFLNDGTETAVVKAEDHQIGVAQMSGDLLQQVAGMKSVKHTKVADNQRAGLTNALVDISKWDRGSLAALGRHKRTTKSLDSAWWSAEKKSLGTAADTMSDAEVGERFVTQSVPYMAQSKWMAMSEAGGMTAGKASATKENAGPDGRTQSRFRRLMQNRKHNVNLGVLTAMDLFMGNADRVMLGNVGNWFYDETGDGMTLIDHVDNNVESLSRKYQVEHKDLARLKKDDLAATAKVVLSGLATGMTDPGKGNDPDFDKFLDANGGMQREYIEEALEEGLKAGRERLIKVFTATRFSGKRSDRKIKKNMKKSAQAALALDREDDDRIGADPNQYYEMLKERAKWLKAN